MTDVFAVFEGGGVKGIAHVGALARFHEETGLTFKGYAGTSAGAIVAALAAAGYRARRPDSPPPSIAPDLNSIMTELNFITLLGASPVPLDKLRTNIDSLRSSLPMLFDALSELKKLTNAGRWHFLLNGRTFFSKYGPNLLKLRELPEILNVLFLHRGMYETSALVEWLRKYLTRHDFVSRNGRVTFSSLEKKTDTILKIVATNLGDPEPRVFGPLHWPSMEVALAVQASISIPLFFWPFPEGDNFLVDGGLRSNYPLWIFAEERIQSGELLPIVGFRFIPDNSARVTYSQVTFADYTGELVNAALEGSSWLQQRNIEGLVEVPIRIPSDIRATSFDIDDKSKELLLNRGYNAAKAVLEDPENRKILNLT